MTKRQPNTEFIREFMEGGSPMRQLFVIAGLEAYARYVVNNPDQKIAGDFISPEAWVHAAEEYLCIIGARGK